MESTRWRSLLAACGWESGIFLRLFRGKRIHNCRPSRIDPFEDEGSIFDETDPAAMAAVDACDEHPLSLHAIPKRDSATENPAMLFHFRD